MESFPAISSLESLIHGRIRREGALRFSEFMALALYEPDHGYYAKGPRQVGREGDFFTSVSVGPLFGELLARRFLSWREEAGIIGDWRIIECGAHDGTLASDILATLCSMDPEAFELLEYVIPEPLPRLQAAQRERLAAYQGRIRLVSSVENLPPLPGVVFGNELLDALPFHVVEWRGGRWCECRVTIADGALDWEIMPDVEGDELRKAVDALGVEFPEGYRTEVRTCLSSFLKPFARVMGKSLFLWPDYGFARPDYYHPSRTNGTLRTFSRHRGGENPLLAPGELDITAHVDFTAVAEVALELGAGSLVFKNQGAWLTAAARPWLLSLEGNPQPGLLRQFQTLTHPAHLGGSFHFLEFTLQDSMAGVVSPQDLHRLAL